MADKTKYDYFMDELISLEKHVGTVSQRSDELHDENSELKERLDTLHSENEALKNKLKEIESKLSNPIVSEGESLPENSINSLEREELKEKISGLISKLDYHLRS